MTSRQPLGGPNTAPRQSRGDVAIASPARPGRQPDARAELLAGLGASTAAIPSKYFYDAVGSRLFETITRLPEYYPTRTEAGILSRYLHEIGRIAGRGGTLIDLGAGNCEKARRLFGVLQPAQYVAVDISTEYLRESLTVLQCLYPGMDIQALALDLAAPLRLPDTVRARRRLFFFPGSSIGNFTPEQAEQFLRGLRDQCAPDGGILVGVDLVKDKAILDAAYDDALGVTAAFNLNMLNHVNAVLGSDFDVSDWRHVAGFDPETSRIQMHLEARRTLTVRWPGGGRTFNAGERIHTEDSYKYRLPDFKAMLARAGFGEISAWTDDRNWFALCHARTLAAV